MLARAICLVGFCMTIAFQPTMTHAFQDEKDYFSDSTSNTRFHLKHTITPATTFLPRGHASPWQSLNSANISNPALIQSAITLEAMIAQMLMIGFAGTSPHQPGPKAVQQLLRWSKIGGLIFMGRNMRSKQQIHKLVRSMRVRSKPPFPPFLAIDQEGGTVQRLTERHGFTPIPSAHYMSTRASPDAAYRTYKKLAGELAKAGFNMNFGPVVDLNRVPQNPVIGAQGRSFGSTSNKVITYAKSFIRAHRKAGLLTSLKHFPGHGSSWTDSHVQFVNISQHWHHSELSPYTSLAKAGLIDSVMVGHLYHPQFADQRGIPASLSQKAIKGVLRGQLGYKGLVITDDMDMAAITKHFTFEDRVIRAVKAGNDILLFSDKKYANANAIQRITKIITGAVAAGKISKSRIRSAYHRIVTAKKRLSKAGKSARQVK